MDVEGYRKGPDIVYICNGCFFLEHSTTLDADYDEFHHYKCIKTKKALVMNAGRVQTPKKCPYITVK